MKISLLVALAELAIGLTVPVVAQQKDAVDRQTVHQRDLLGIPKALGEFGELGLKLDEAYNKNDASAVAALFTEEGFWWCRTECFVVGRPLRKGMRTFYRGGRSPPLATSVVN
jgi:hypothetical protein